MPPEPKTRAKLNDAGDGKGQFVYLPRSQLQQAGVDPDAELEVNRAVLDGKYPTIRLRIYEVDESG